MKQLYLFRTICFTILVCIFTETATAQTCQLGISVSTINSKCKATGVITVAVTNGSGNYNYIVTSPTYNTNTSSNIIDGLQAGTYTVKVKDIASGCTIEENNVVIGGSYQDPRFNLTATDVSCLNAANGSIAVSNLQFGKSPFTYTIVAPSASGTGTSNTTGVFTNLTAGDYYVQLSDSCGGLQTRVITVANYNWTPVLSLSSKPTCDSTEVTLSVSDNRGNNNSGSPVFNGFLYGATVVAGDTTWSTSRVFRFYKATYRRATLIVKDLCGNMKSVVYTDNIIPNVNATVTTSNYQCAGFTATVTGQQNLTNPQYCLYNSSNTLITCNTSGVFTNVAYGSYCIAIRDNCYDTTFNRCFSVAQPAPAVAATVGISNLVCSGFDATITGQQNLSSPQFCLYDSTNTLVVCNTTGAFTNIPYGPYCINITDGCTGTVITRCFTQRRAVPLVANNFIYSNQTCATFTVGVTGQANLVNPQYCLYDINNNLVACNSTGVFNNLIYGSYCMQIKNDPVCFDTTILRCFTAGAPVPAVGGTPAISNKTCTGFTAKITGQQNLTNPKYYLTDNSNTVIDSNTTGQFDNLPYGSYCINTKNDGNCYDTTIQRCFSVTVPVPAVGATVTVNNKACTTFSAAITGQANLTSPKYYLLDNSSTAIDSNTTGTFNNIPYGAYCIRVVNTCYDTSFTRCFSANPNPVTVTVGSTASCTIGKTNLAVTIGNGIAPYTISIYNPWGVLVNTTTSSTSVTNITGLAGLPSGFNYKVFASGACSGIDSATVTPLAYTLTKSINANSKCPGGLWLNGSGDLLVNAQFSGGTVTPSVIKMNGAAVSINYSTQSGSNFTFSNMQPATYIVQYTLQTCGNIVYDTFDLKPYDYPNLNQSAVYQCNNNNFSVSAAANGGLAPFTYEIIGSSPSSPAIIQAPQGAPTFGINNGTTYSLVRLRVIDACGNAAINDASILPLANTIVTASSDCYYASINLSVDSIANATYTWYKKTSPADSVLVSSNQTHTIPYLLPSDTGVYVNVMSVNNGCLQKVSSFHITGMCGMLLSVNGLSFSAAPDKDNVQLKWTTARAFDAVSFIIERSTDGSSYKEIGHASVSTGNNISTSQYFFSDVNAEAGKNYYRLRIIKSNGRIAYSNVEVITKKGSVSVSVMPNPVAASFTIRFQPNAYTKYNVSLLGADGKGILNNNYSVRPGDTKTIQRPATIATGVYYLVVINQSTNEKDIIKLFFK